MLLVTVAFANNFLTARMAENEFGTVKQFMQTAGYQIDDVSWTIGRTQTIRYTSMSGRVDFQSAALSYNISLNDSPIANFTYSTGILLYNMPVTSYNLGNGYHENIIPASDRSFLQKGTSAPVCHVFVVEKLLKSDGTPMNDGAFIRVVLAPSIRMLNSTITTSNTTQNYYKFYLPILNQGSSPRLSQSVTLVGTTVAVETEGDVNKISIQISFPKSGLGFDNDFFAFAHITEVVGNIPSGSIIEFYTGEVTVSLGLHA